MCLNDNNFPTKITTSLNLCLEVTILIGKTVQYVWDHDLVEGGSCRGVCGCAVHITSASGVTNFRTLKRILVAITKSASSSRTGLRLHLTV